MIKQIINGLEKEIANVFDPSVIQNKDLRTPITIGGVQQTTVEGALSALAAGGGGSGDSSITAVVESSPATAAHVTGTYVYYNGVTYAVIDDISIGDALVVDTNIEVPTLPEGTMVYVPDADGEMDAGMVGYDNTVSGLSATTVKGAIDELALNGGGGGGASLVANMETSPASASHNVGDYIFYNGSVYEVMASIDVDDVLVVDTNIRVPVLPEGAVVYIPENGTSITAEDVTFDNSDTDLEATDVQAAIVELANKPNADNSIVAVREQATAVAAHAVDDYVRLSDVIYVVTDTISIGDSLVVDTNIEAATLAEGTIVYTIDPS